MDSASPDDVRSGESAGLEPTGPDPARTEAAGSEPGHVSPSSSEAPDTASDSASSPSRSESTLRLLDASVRIIWGLKYAGAWTLLLFAVFFYDLTHLFGPSWLPFGVMSAVVFVVGLLYSLFWPQVRYKRWGFELRPEELYLEHGVVTNVRTIVPLRRIQHLDVSQDLLEREFGLGRLIVHTAGSRSSDVVIPGLQLDEAERIRDEVKRFILEDPLMEDPV